MAIGKPARVQHPPRSARSVDDADDGYANDSPMETRKRFPQGFGNLAKNARFPHSHSQDLGLVVLTGEKNRRSEDNALINN